MFSLTPSIADADLHVHARPNAVAAGFTRRRVLASSVAIGAIAGTGLTGVVVPAFGQPATPRATP
jgi:hypothetical protein